MAVCSNSFPFLIQLFNSKGTWHAAGLVGKDALLLHVALTQALRSVKK